jgi:hypothetical protein
VAVPLEPADGRRRRYGVEGGTIAEMGDRNVTLPPREPTVVHTVPEVEPYW